MSSRLSGFRIYVQLVWHDILCLLLVLFLIIGLFFAPINRQAYRVVPMWPVKDEFGGYMLRGPVEYSYPYVPEILSSLGCGLIITLLPTCVILTFQLKLRSWWDIHSGIFGILKAVVIATLAQIVLKQSIGGFRPHFLSVCQPDIGRIPPQNITIVSDTHWIPITACTGDPKLIRYALTSFPSGHTSSSFAVAVFLSLYINAKLKTLADFAPDFWAVFFTISPLIGAAVIAGGLHVDHHHHPRDIIFGIAIGVIAGLLAYRTSYASLLDFRYNHIPLPPFRASIRFSYDINQQINGSDQVLIPKAAYTDKLVVMSWWGTGNEKTRSSESLWLRALTPLCATNVASRHADSLSTPASEGRDVENIRGDARSLNGSEMTGALPLYSEFGVGISNGQRVADRHPIS